MSIARPSEYRAHAERARTANACPVTGRSATACEDPTHAGCVAGHAASVALDRAIEEAHDG